MKARLKGEVEKWNPSIEKTHLIAPILILSHQQDDISISHRITKDNPTQHKEGIGLGPNHVLSCNQQILDILSGTLLQREMKNWERPLKISRKLLLRTMWK